MIPPRASLALGLAALVVVGGVAAAVRTPGPASAEAFLTDAEGRALVPSGFNTASSSKQVASGLPDFTEDDLDTEYADMGTNFVRYLISWRKIEPEPGVYDQGYLDDVEERIGWYADRGYHVMLDMHQDLWGNAITPSGMNGNGAPAWATYMDGLPVAESLPMWELYYLEPGVIRAFDNFWNTTGAHPELMDHYAGAWRAVAARFADNEAVVAYDLMNEPYGGTVQGPAFEAGPLTALYQKSVDAIREVDDDTWACLEPQALGFNWGLPSGLGFVDDPRDGAARIAFCPHIYPLPMDLGDGFAGVSRDLVEGTVAAWRSNALRTAQALGGVPVILGEFGLNTELPGAIDYVELMYETSDASGFGVVYWSRDPGSWGPYDAEGEPRNLVEAVSRPYPRAVAGDLRSWEVGPDVLTIRLGAAGGGDIDGGRSGGGAAVSEAYLPADGFPDGAEITGGEIVAWDAATGVIGFTIDSGATEIVIRAR
ncbi:cellulase family glycosylhydrolase [Microbacterium hominis]|uniref:Cellulase family glycosylhydrolase n=1 Tax=Microbacterium hominis TaxID=162426 RepID=A0A7D4TPE8_9MICO|nr:cellulase family glycosylhydrolase [Microbacterium hominis]QKJ18144.1 cellulase family glycosylhydrolase [Microbacterium hominis]